MLKIYHYPSCSKSKACLQILEDQDYPFQLIDYVKKGLSREELNFLAEHILLADLIRDNESIYKALNLENATRDELLQAVIENPTLLQRPILVLNDKVLVARPPEKVLEFIND